MEKINIEKPDTPERQELTTDQFKENIEKALAEAIEKIDNLKGSANKSAILDRMQKNILQALDVQENINSMYNI